MKDREWKLFLEPKWLPNQNALNNTPNDYFFGLLRPALHDYLSGDTGYEETFNIFEYLLALTYLDIVDESYSHRGKFCRYAEPHGHSDHFLRMVGITPLLLNLCARGLHRDQNGVCLKLVSSMVQLNDLRKLWESIRICFKMKQGGGSKSVRNYYP